MIYTDPTDFFCTVLSLEPKSAAVMKQAFLVSPDYFKLSHESAQDNHYMLLEERIDVGRAKEQHLALKEKLVSLGVPVITFPGVSGHDDGVFPNNAYATTAGRLIIGRMRHAVRQQETTRKDIRNYFENQLHYEVVDLSVRPLIAELTGVLVIDRMRMVGYCGMSERVDWEGCQAMHEAFGLNATLWFPLGSGEYHLNMVFAVLAGQTCVLHRDSFRNHVVADAITAFFGPSCIEIDTTEKLAFVGNCLAVTVQDILMSLTAKPLLRPKTIDAFARAGLTLHFCDVSEFEKAGGSLRCLVAEVF